MAADLPALRSLQDFLTDAQFTAPTLNDLERMSNRMANNLLYYQTNYFLLAILIFVIVGSMYPKDLILGAFSLVAVSVLYRVASTKDKHIEKLGKQHPVLGPLAVFGLVFVLIYLLGSILVFIWGVTMPLGVVLLHSACRKRNLKNKFTNMAELKDNTTPMSMILGMVCQMEEEMEQAARDRMS